MGHLRLDSLVFLCGVLGAELSFFVSEFSNLEIFFEVGKKMFDADDKGNFLENVSFFVCAPLEVFVAHKRELPIVAMLQTSLLLAMIVKLLPFVPLAKCRQCLVSKNFNGITLFTMINPVKPRV